MTHNPPAHVQQCHIQVAGIVQGVGFRPHVWQLAQQFKLVGEVNNDCRGVNIIVQGLPSLIQSFIKTLKTDVPQQARITEFVYRLVEPDASFSAFSIVASDSDSSPSAAISPDLVTCSACKKELFTAGNRRYHYPFINCTHCGPRLSILKALPYDRANTSMAEFNQCDACQSEYDDPTDRRFHAQPNACENCGPRVWLTDNSGNTLCSENVISQAVARLKRGEILAIKGLGGFQLCVDAKNSDAVIRLRERKHRPHKPFALMARNCAMVKQYCDVSDLAKGQLESAAGPIVLLPVRQTSPSLDGIAPGQRKLGFMLPTSPIHLLLLELFNRPLIMTSANPAGEPQCIDNQHALQRMGQIADAFLMHNRDITQRVDDSVVQLSDLGVQPIRRARGLAPSPITLPQGFERGEPILALGGDLKNTFCMLDSSQALLSQYIGDLGDLRTEQDLQRCLALYTQIREFTPTRVALDQHPEYRSRQLGVEIAEKAGAKCEEIQHHHAHIASCMGDNGYSLHATPILGICMDGLGYAYPKNSTNNNESTYIWGAEILLADYLDFTQVATLKPTPLPGGDMANTQPWRNCLAQLHQCLGWQTVCEQYSALPLVETLNNQNAGALVKLIEQQRFSPLSSSAGRLFDAVAAALGICDSGSIEYEGKAAMLLEAQINESDWQHETPYPFDVVQHNDIWIVDPASMWQALLDDLQNRTANSKIAARFHLGLADAYASLASKLANHHGTTTVALSGGVMQNMHLQQRLSSQLSQAGHRVLTHQQVPANDGGLAFGQALIARARHLKSSGELPCV